MGRALGLTAQSCAVSLPAPLLGAGQFWERPVGVSALWISGPGIVALGFMPRPAAAGSGILSCHPSQGRLQDPTGALVRNATGALWEPSSRHGVSSPTWGLGVASWSAPAGGRLLGGLTLPTGPGRCGHGRPCPCCLAMTLLTGSDQREEIPQPA